MSEPERREPLDLDRLQEVVVAIGGFALYVIGAIGGAFAVGATFGAWVGFLLLIVVGLLPSAWSLKKAADRKAEQRRRDDFRASQERTVGGVETPILP